MLNEVRTLTVLLERHERDRNAALMAHQRALMTSRNEAAKSEQLAEYRRSYGQRWHGEFQRQGEMTVVHCYQSFMERLNLAVEQQAQVATFSAQETERAMEAVQAAEMRCAAVRKLIERRTLEHRLAAERRDQKQTDEAATRAAFRRLGQGTRPAPL